MKENKVVYTKIDPLPIEPWVKLETNKDLSDWGKVEEIQYNQSYRVTEKAHFFRKAFDYICSSQIDGDYYEFGCHRARTFRMALTESRKHNKTSMNYLAFDSFEGLPLNVINDADVQEYKKNALTTTEEEFLKIINKHGLYLDKIDLYKGYYKDSLTDTLQEKLISERKKISLVNIDCDLYESALPIFPFIDPLLQLGSVIYIDDLFAGYKGNPYKGVGRAFVEWQKHSIWKFIPYLSVGWWGRSYIVVESNTDTTGIL